MRPTSDHAGFTLIEMIIVIAITAIVGSMVAVFLRAPLESYVAQDRRARLADTADTALRRMGRDIRLALPNSVRVTSVGNVVYLEFLATRNGGRYRAQGGGDILDFTAPDNSFDVLGPGIDMQAGDLIAVYNLGIPGADAWAGETLAAYTGVTALNVTTIAIASKQFPLASPGNRFQVVEGPVSYVCDPNAGTLTRYWGYPIAAAQPTPPTAPVSSALLAKDVSACSFTYQPGATERNGLVSMTLNLSQAGETVRLYATTQVSNQP
ncbi:MAG: prepilin-type N-terminal cleavage/methylation domain-containing protein [Hydrogenophilales bacterium]|nr:prepilin-type N-terminal cleavage/methylation domain-containing protein [Hydrogenophilales bacterium]